MEAMRHVVGGESSASQADDVKSQSMAPPSPAQDNEDVEAEERRLFEEVFQTDEEYKWFEECERRTHTQRSVMCYKDYPELLIDDEHVGFPALHEIGETIDELQLIMHALIMKYSMSL
uniref:Uncharacterized protein n=1 Tax=Ceratitis capitata TaxID=7213 RepID=W8B4B2_CERCA